MRVAMVGASRVGQMLAMVAASEAMSRSYDFEYGGGTDRLLRRKDNAASTKMKFRKIWYTADSPEVIAMSKPYYDK